MEVGRRRSTGRGGGVVAGSVWESRMKSDEVKGGIKVFNGDETSEEAGERKSRPKQSPNGVIGKRKTWKSENSDGFEKSPIQIARQRSDLKIDLDEQFKELSKSADGMIKKKAQFRKRGPDLKKLRRLVFLLIELRKKPVQIRKAKSESVKLIGQSPENSVQSRKVKPESNKGLGESVDVNERNSTPPNKGTSVSSEVLGQPMKEFDGLGDENERNPIEPKTVTLESVETRSDETCKELDVCEEKVISSGLSNVGMVKSVPEMAMIDDVGDEIGDEEDDWDEELDDEIEIEEVKKRFEVKEIDITEQKPKTEQVVNEEKSTPISPIVKKQGPPLVQTSQELIQSPQKLKLVLSVMGSKQILGFREFLKPITNCRV
ncbi:reticulon family protein [Actinidia rufa]|uniref:Reticulon family protein n=1 Tax=Actinidia rufa TaxID=165716 RepID=A0A7J0DGH3_9ERIC|nr:reticulon family protein [Actinidia rufa]